MTQPPNPKSGHNLTDLERLDGEILEAERRAVRGLATHLRNAVRDLPSESKLGLIFVQHAKRFELWATGPRPASGTKSTLGDLYKELGELGREGGDA